MRRDLSVVPASSCLALFSVAHSRTENVGTGPGLATAWPESVTTPNIGVMTSVIVRCMFVATVLHCGRPFGKSFCGVEDWRN